MPPGGVNGRKIKLISYDDGYEPEKVAATTQKLIGQDKVFALFGYVGTPTSKAAVPFAVKAGVPYVGPFSGAEFLRNPVTKVVYNVRASYFDETEGMVEHLTKDLGIKKIGVFIQDDAYGDAGKSEFDYTSLEGYVDAVVMVEALKKTGKDLTRESFLKTMEGLSPDLGGLKIAYKPTSHQGINEIFHSVVKGGKPVPIAKY